MTQLRRILTPTDFSKISKLANRKALDMAKQNGAELLLLHVIEGTDMPMREVMRHTSFPNLADEIRKGSERELKELKEELVGDTVPCRTIVRTGDPAVEVADCAKEEQADMIVIATRGYGAVRRFFLGSTAERVMRIAPCSVLLVREEDAEDPD